MIEAKAEVNTYDFGRQTALLHTSWGGHTYIAATLLWHKVRVHLMTTCETRNTIDLILSEKAHTNLRTHAQADINAKKAGMSSLDISKNAKFNDMIKLNEGFYRRIDDSKVVLKAARAQLMAILAEPGLDSIIWSQWPLIRIFERGNDETRQKI